MILVDTSVMIAFLRGTKNKQTNKLETIIENELPFGINDFIYQEVLQGAKTEKEKSSSITVLAPTTSTMSKEPSP